MATGGGEGAAATVVELVTQDPAAVPSPALNVAPGSVVVVRDEEWLVTGVEHTRDGALLTVQGLSELVRETTASFYERYDDIAVHDPAEAMVLADPSPGYRRARLWLEATLRKTAVPLDVAELTVSTRMLATALDYQQAAVRKALDPANLRPRILLADAVGLGKTLEIGMILAELARRGRGERVLIVSPRHVLEQVQHELWCRFALLPWMSDSGSRMGADHGISPVVASSELAGVELEQVHAGCAANEAVRSPVGSGP